MLVAALAVAGTIKDRRISLEEAERMATAAQARGTLPIPVNASVVEQLNRLLGTPDGRAFVRESLERMEIYRELVSGKIAQYGLLVEEGIRATGSRDVWEIVRNGYENDPDYVARTMAAMLIMQNPSYLE